MFSSSKHPEQLWGTPRSLFNVYWASSQAKVISAQSWPSPPFNSDSEVKDKWSYTLTPPYALTVWTRHYLCHHTQTHTHPQYKPIFIRLGKESRSYYEMADLYCPFDLHFNHNFQKSVFSYLYVKGLWRFSILREIQAMIISNRLHVVCKRLTVFIEPQNLQQ